MKHDVFISFSSKDRSEAEDIVKILNEKYGLTCWICVEDIHGGQRYKRLIPQAIRDSGVVVFIQSKNAIRSKEIPKEIGLAFDEDIDIIPYKIDTASLKGAEIEYDLYGINFIDGTVPTFDQRMEDLVVAVRKALSEVRLRSDDSASASDVTTGIVSEERTYRREIANSVFEYLDDVINNRS